MKNIIVIIICISFICGSVLFGKILWFPLIFFTLGLFIFIYKAITPQKTKLADDELFFRLNDTGVFDYTENGFYDGYLKYEWKNICEIIAYKNDLFSIDCICMNIKFCNDYELSVNEEYPGWYQFITRLEKEIKLKDNWLKIVSKPAFNRNETVIYKKTINAFKQ